jgi:hypothetical protein
MKNSEPPYMGPLIPDADLINVCIDMARVLMHRNCELEARLAALEQPADAAEPAPALAGVAEPQPVETSARIFREFQQTVDRLLSSPARRRNAQEVAFECGLSYAALGQRLRRHPPPLDIARKNEITNQWEIYSVPELKAWWQSNSVRKA